MKYLPYAFAFALGWFGMEAILAKTDATEVSILKPLCPRAVTFPYSYYAMPGYLGDALCYEV